jgi:hypothetical protein
MRAVISQKGPTMASTTQVTYKLDDNAITYDIVGHTPTASLYKNTLRSLSLPQTLDYQYKLGVPGAKGNDKIIVNLKNTVQDGTTNEFFTGSVKVEISLPRNDAWTATDTKDILVQLQDIFADAKVPALAVGVTP